jgi:outer membrane lipoprotein-sorting protein
MGMTRRMPNPKVAFLAAIALAVPSGALAQSTDEATKPPDQILADVQRDLAKVKSFHLTSTTIDDSGKTTIVGDIFASGRLRLSVSTKDMRARILRASSGFYVYGNARYWKASGADSKTAKRLANRWVKVPSSATETLAQSFEGLTPKALAACTTVNNGTVTSQGASTLSGQRVVVLSDAGDKPGSSPGQMWVSTEGPVLPLRISQTGPSQPGGTGDPACSSEGDTTKSSDARLSRFDRASRVRAPKHAISVSPRRI